MQTKHSLSAFPTKHNLSGPRDLNLGPGNTGTLYSRFTGKLHPLINISNALF